MREWTNKGFFRFVVGHHMAGFVDGNEGDVSCGCAISTDGPHHPCDFPGRLDPPQGGGGMDILREENAGEFFNPS